jgi:hypothetical protein
MWSRKKGKESKRFRKLVCAFLTKACLGSNIFRVDTIRQLLVSELQGLGKAFQLLRSTVLSRSTLNPIPSQSKVSHQVERIRKRSICHALFPRDFSANSTRLKIIKLSDLLLILFTARLTTDGLSCVVRSRD